jgi:hydrogenase maturation protease
MSAFPPSAGPLLVVGVGNSLMTDDGIGIAAVERLRDGWELNAEVELVDGGLWLLSLLPAVEDSSGLLLLDAINAKQPPGTVIELERDEIPRFLEAMLSPHQVGVRDLLALCSLRDSLPARTAALGIQPARIELGTELSPIVQGSLDMLLERVVRRLDEWGYPALERRVAQPVSCTR